MKKAFLGFVLFGFLWNVYFAFSQDDSRIKGAYKSSIICGYEYKFGMANTITKLKIQSNKYDDKGNITERILFNTDSTIEKKIKYKYDDKGNPVERVRLKGGTTIIDVKTNQYGSLGKKTKEINYEGSGSIKSKYIYRYDDKGNEVEKIRYNGDGTVAYKSICKYDEAGMKTWQTDSGEVSGIIDTSLFKFKDIDVLTENKMDNNQTIIKYTFKYDEIGREIGMSLMLSDSTTLPVCETKYDEKGRKTEKIAYTSSGSVQTRIKYSYNDAGNISEINTFVNNIGNKKAVFNYDDKGNIITAIKYVCILDEPVYNYEWAYGY
ncbi:MAG: hypothetical protein PHR81_04315 [Bacteroidales bacterium]|nr:hypothetical protein [Bacteroidales bacterium]